MLEIAVQVKGIDKGNQARWVIAIDPAGDRFLLVDGETKKFEWHPIPDCKFIKIVPPDAPRPVVVVQAAPGLVVARRDLPSPDGGSG